MEALSTLTEDVMTGIWIAGGSQAALLLTHGGPYQSAQRKPILKVELSGVFELRAANRYRLQ
jgi:hypothetical protein